MAARKKKKQINLLPQEEFAASTKGRILTWFLSTFRIVVVATQVLIMAAFLSRFWLDVTSADLSDEIEQKQRVVEAFREFESDFKNTQKKLRIISNLSEQDSNTTSILNEISSRLPSDIYLTTYSFEENEVKIKGLSPRESSIAQAIVNLQEIEGFDSVKLTQLDTEEGLSSLLVFGITLSKGGVK